MSDHLPPRAQAILELARDAHDPTEAESGRVRERVAMTLAATVAGSAAASTAQAAAAGALGSAASAGAAGGTAAGGAAAGGVLAAAGGKALLSVGLTKIVGTASLLAAMAGGTAAVMSQGSRPALRTPAPAPAEQRAVPAPRVDVAPANQVEPKPRPVEELGPIAEPVEAPSEVTRPSPKASVPRATEPQSAADNDPSAGSLGREVALIRDATRALQRGEPALALEQLAEHARSFPSGTLAAEREGLAVIALCQSGNPDAREAARRLLASSPVGVLSARIRKACEVE